MDPATLTATLDGVVRGDADAMERLVPVVYQEMRRLAAHYLRAERAGHTLQPTALANEAYLRLVGNPDAEWRGRQHFLAVAARTMRSILVDHARRRRAQKRGGGQPALPLDTGLLVAGQRPVEFDDLDHALEDLAKRSDRQARVVELRYFGGLTVEEIATLMDVSPVTVKRDWTTARAWLYRELVGTKRPDA